MLKLELTEDQKLDLVRQAIQTKDGWKALALSINSPEAKETCIALLRKVGGTKEVIQSLKPIGDSSNTYQPVKVKFADLLVQQLEEYLVRIEAEKK